MPAVRAVYVTNATNLTFTGGSVNAVQSGAWTVSLGAPVTVSGSVTVANPAQGDALAGVTGPMMQAAVSAAEPALTDGKVQPLSLTPRGQLRVLMDAEDGDPWDGLANPFDMEDT